MYGFLGVTHKRTVTAIHRFARKWLGDDVKLCTQWFEVSLVDANVVSGSSCHFSCFWNLYCAVVPGGVARISVKMRPRGNRIEVTSALPHQTENGVKSLDARVRAAHVI